MTNHTISIIDIKMNDRAIVYNTPCLNSMQTFIELVSNVSSYVRSQMFDKPCTSLTLLVH